MKVRHTNSSISVILIKTFSFETYQKLSPGGDGTKNDWRPYPLWRENGWEPKTTHQAWPSWPDYQVRGNTGNHEQTGTGAGVHKETHTPRKSQQYSPQGQAESTPKRVEFRAASLGKTRVKKTLLCQGESFKCQRHITHVLAGNFTAVLTWHARRGREAARWNMH